MLIGIIALGSLFGFAVSGISVMMGGSFVTAVWLYPVSGIACSLVICLAKFICASVHRQSGTEFITSTK